MTEPTPATFKQLFALSGNLCAFPGCREPMVDPDSREIIGEICHIKGRRPIAKRHDPQQTEEERRAFENLILLCPKHHKIIDGNHGSYSVEAIVRMKLEHLQTTQPVPEPSDAIVNEFLRQYAEIHAELVETNKATLTVLQQRLYDQRLERAGPVLAYLDDQLRTIERWLMWVSDRRMINSILGRQPSVLLEAAHGVLEQAKKVSPRAYQSLAAGRDRLQLFDGSVYELRSWHQDDSRRGYWSDKQDEYFGFISNSRVFLEEAQQLLSQAKAAIEQALDAGAA